MTQADYETLLQTIDGGQHTTAGPDADVPPINAMAVVSWIVASIVLWLGLTAFGWFLVSIV